MKRGVGRPKGPPMKVRAAGINDAILTGTLLIDHKPSGEPFLLIDVYCPLCHKMHRHGWSEVDRPYDAISHRVAHCVDGSQLHLSGYYIGLGMSSIEREHNRQVFAKYTDQLARWQSKQVVQTSEKEGA